MTKAKIKAPFILSKLKETPRKGLFDIHYWADYIELKCLFNPDALFSKDDFLDIYRDNKDFNPKKDVEFEEDDDEISLADSAYNNDREERFADNCFKLLESRIRIFKDNYPFLLSSNKRALIKKKTLSWKHRCYLFLLFSASLKYLKNYQSLLTSCFEVYSLFVLKNILPLNAEAHIFGSGNGIIKKRRYTGHIWEKLNKLKDDLNEIMIKALKKDFPDQDSGDGGFDFIAWIPNGDKQSHVVTFTGQAACTSNWENKKYSSSSSALSSLIPVSVPPINLVFIPFSLRNADESWIRAHDIGECVLLDRQRLLYHFNNNQQKYLSLPCDKIILELLKLKESAYN